MRQKSQASAGGAAAKAPAAQTPPAVAKTPKAQDNGATHAAAPAVAAPIVAPPAQPIAAAKPAVAAPAPTAAAAPSTAAPKKSGGLSLNREELEKFLVAFVVEQTGYPEEMVELDADLEADLGIDSIKKAQMVAELADQMDVQVEINEDLTLDDFPTLGHVVDFLEQAASGGTASAAPTAPQQTTAPAATPVVAQAVTAPAPTVAVAQPAPAAASTPAPAAAAASTPAPAAPKKSGGLSLNRQELEKFLVDFVVEQTGYPEEMVELDADLEADLGIDSIKKAQMVAELADQMDVQVEINEDLTLDDFPTLGHVVDFLEQAATGGSASAQAPAPQQTSAPAAPAAAPAQPVPAPVQTAPAAPVVTAPPVQPAPVAQAAPVVQPAPVVQAAPAATAVATPAAPRKSGGMSLNRQELEKFLVDFVVEQTGYPEEMVELDADLEADLGIDSIKKAQMVAELADQMDVQVEINEDLTLDDFPTLGHVVDFLEKAAVGGATASAQVGS